MNKIKCLIIIIFILIGVETVGMRIAEGASPKKKSSPANITKNEQKRSYGTKLSAKTKFTNSKARNTEKPFFRNSGTVQKSRNTSRGFSNVQPKTKIQNKSSKQIKTLKTEKKQQSTRENMKNKQQRMSNSGAVHSSKDLENGLKEGLKKGLKYGLKYGLKEGEKK